MRKTLGILLILALIAGIFVSCSQDKVGSMVDEDLVSVSFSSEGVSRALTVSRETFNENNYVWYYKSAKADSTGLRQGEKDTWTPVKPTTGTRTGLSGARITGLSQGLWNFELQAYVYDSGDAQDKDYAATGVAAWYGKVTNQSVRKDAANIVYVTVSAISEGNGSIYWKEISGMKELDQQTTLSFAQIVAAGMKVYVSATKVGATAAAAEFTIDSDTIEGMTGLFTAVPYGTYLFNMKVFSGTDIAHADYIYADETIAVNVYSGLKTIITGFISELSSYVEFGEPVANAVIEAETPNIATAPVTEDVVFTNKQTEESTSFSTAVIKADAADAIRTAVIQTVTEGNTLSDLSLALNVEDKGSTDATSGTTTTTTKSFDISLTQIVTQTNDSTGVSTVTSSNVENVSKHLVIDLNVGAGLQNFKAYHNVGGVDKLMGEVSSDVLPEPGSADYNEFGYFWYKSSSGVVTLFVDSFSPFSVTYDTKDPVARVIKVNGTGADYYSLQEAFDAAGDGDTVKLLQDIDYVASKNSSYHVDGNYAVFLVKSFGNLTIDGNGKTITLSASESGIHDAILLDANGGTGGDNIDNVWNIKDLNLVTSGFQVAIMINAEREKIHVANINNVNILTDGESIYANGEVTANVSNSVLTHSGVYAAGKDDVYYSAVIAGYNGAINLSGCSINSFGNAVSTFPSGGSITLTDCDVTATIVDGMDISGNVIWCRNEDYKTYPQYTGNSTITVNSGSYDGGVYVSHSWESEKTNHLYAKVIINGGEFTDFEVPVSHIKSGCDLASSGHVVITGGTFDDDPSVYVAPGYQAFAQGTNPETWVVEVANDLVITKSGTEPMSLSLADFRDSVNGLNGKTANTFEGYTVTLLRDVDLTGSSWTPIGTTEHPFSGTFDGGGHTISNLSNRGLTADTIDDANPNDYNNNNVGFALFNKVAGTVVVKNLKISAYISGKDRYYAGLIGDLGYSPAGIDLTIENVEVSGKIIGDRSAGIIAQAPNYGSSSAQNKLEIISCVNNATLIGDRTAGILASNGDPRDTDGYTRISGCTNNGFIDARNGADSFAAGIVANTNTFTKCYIEDCENNGKIYASTAYNISMNSYIYNNPNPDPDHPERLDIKIIGETDPEYSNVITDLSNLINLYHCYTGGACLDENGKSEALNWESVEKRIGTTPTETSNTLFVGLFAGIEYNVDSDVKAIYSFDYHGTTYEFKFADMDAALKFLNYSEMYKNLKVYADFEWTSDYSKEGDGPGYYSIDLNGHAMTLKAPVQRQNYVTINGLQKTVTIKNGTIAYDSEYAGYIFDHIEKGGKVVFENVTLSAPAGQQIISIYPSTNDTDIITVVIDEDCEGFDGKKIKCLSPGTAGDDCLVLNDTNVPVSASDSNWTSCGDGTSEYVID